jgi:hypothetical protein
MLGFKRGSIKTHNQSTRCDQKEKKTNYYAGRQTRVDYLGCNFNDSLFNIREICLNPEDESLNIRCLGNVKINS